LASCVIRCNIGTRTLGDGTFDKLHRAATYVDGEGLFILINDRTEDAAYRSDIITNADL
jgi:hypothetical protein